MEPFKIHLSELITIGAIIVSVTTAYVLLSAEVKGLHSEMVEVRIVLDKVQEEQFRVRYILGVKEGWELSSQDAEELRNEVAKKPWRSTRLGPLFQEKK